MIEKFENEGILIETRFMQSKNEDDEGKVTFGSLGLGRSQKK